MTGIVLITVLLMVMMVLLGLERITSVALMSDKVIKKIMVNVLLLMVLMVIGIVVMLMVEMMLILVLVMVMVVLVVLVVVVVGMVLIMMMVTVVMVMVAHQNDAGILVNLVASSSFSAKNTKLENIIIPMARNNINKPNY